MNDDSYARTTSNTGSVLMGFAIGAAVGAGIALLFAPESGRKTRERLASSARRWTKDAEETVLAARDSMSELGEDARSAIKAGQEAFTRDLAGRESRSERRSAKANEDSPVPSAANGTTE